MTIALPAAPSPRSVSPRLISNRRDLEPALGGPTQRVQRVGARWALDVEMPPIPYDAAMAWVAALVAGDAEPVRLALPQPGFDTGEPGSPRVNGGGQAGRSLILDGFGAYTAKAGQFFSIAHASGRHLHMVRADLAAAAGAMALAFEPMLRRSPADNTVVEFETPMIEGFLSGRETGWTVDLARTVGLSFTITERE